MFLTNTIAFLAHLKSRVSRASVSRPHTRGSSKSSKPFPSMIEDFKGDATSENDWLPPSKPYNVTRNGRPLSKVIPTGTRAVKPKSKDRTAKKTIDRTSKTIARRSNRAMVDRASRTKMDRTSRASKAAADWVRRESRSTWYSRSRGGTLRRGDSWDADFWRESMALTRFE